ncbi:MAG: hypothetical protein FWH23_07800, partial [Bacteroidales bacterium]|nr:hypothetical protein [Bacteroidales bacterium]
MRTIIIKLCLTLCMFFGISYNASEGLHIGTKVYAQPGCPPSLQELGLCWLYFLIIECEEYDDYWDCDPDGSTELDEVLIIAAKPPGDDPISPPGGSGQDYWGSGWDGPPGTTPTTPEGSGEGGNTGGNPVPPGNHLYEGESHIEDDIPETGDGYGGGTTGDDN